MTSTAPPRDRLLRAAAQLFYAEGVSVGVERLCRAAGVSKRSMYQLFATKDEVIAEALRTHGPASVAAYFPDPAADMPPRERILHVFARLEEFTVAPSTFHGCPFVNTAIELHDASHRASGVALQFKQQLEVYFHTHAEALGAPDPGFLAAQLTMLFDGAAVRAVMRAAPLDGLALRAAAQLLINTCGPV